jgi:hypothetical protein
VNAPKRWSNAGSEVDPVVRSLIGYAKSQAPSTVEVERLVASVTARRVRAVPRLAAWRARMHTAAAVAAAVACGGLAWAGFGRVLDVVTGSAPEASESATVAASATSRAPARKHGASPRLAPTVVAPEPPLAPPPSALAVAKAPIPPVPAATSGDAATRSAPKSSSASKLEPAPSVDDVSTLALARRSLATDPGQALALTEKSARDNPRSQFAEERAAIAIEALERLGRLSEAERRFDAFERSYPESLYRRRLRAGLTGR